MLAKLPPTYSDVELNPDAAVSPDGSLVAIQEGVGAVIWDLQRSGAQGNPRPEQCGDLVQSRRPPRRQRRRRPGCGSSVGPGDGRSPGGAAAAAAAVLLRRAAARPLRASWRCQSRLHRQCGCRRQPGVAFQPQPSARFSPDGDLVATWGWGGAKLWEPFGTREVERLGAGSLANGRPLSTAISPDGRLVAKADANHLIELRRTRTAARWRPCGEAPATSRGSRSARAVSSSLRRASIAASGSGASRTVVSSGR